MSLLLIIILSLLAGITSIISTSGEIFDRRRKWYKMVKNLKGWVYLISTFLLVLIPIIQKIIQDSEDSKKEAQAKILQDKRDSVMQYKHDSSLIASTLRIKNDFDQTIANQTSVMSNTLGKYGYALDSANQKLYKIVKDSSKVTYVQQANPTFTLAGYPSAIELISKVDDKYQFKINCMSFDATSTDVSLDCSIVLCEPGYPSIYRYYGKELFDVKEAVIPKGMMVNKEFSVSASYPFSQLIIYVKGNYKNQEKSKQFKINQLFCYDLPTMKVTIMEGENKMKLISFVEKTEGGK